MTSCDGKVMPSTVKPENLLSAQLVQAHQDSNEEDTTKPIPPQETEKMCSQILKRFYSCTIESILTGCITAWYGNCSASDHKAPQRVVCAAQYITGAKLPAIQALYTRRC